MSNSRRGSIELFAEILENLLSNPMKKAQLSQKCNLDYRTVTRYLLQLESRTHVDRSKNDRTVYVITNKGSSFVRHYRDLLELLEKDVEDKTKNDLSSIKPRIRK